ncbi:MAG: hypothetical protein WC154_08340 [Candidatus Izemoplasmatales bacterium]
MLKHKQKKWRQVRLFIIGILIGLLIGISIIWWFSYLKNANWFFTNNIVSWVTNLFSSSAENTENTDLSLIEKQKNKKTNPTIIDEHIIIEDTLMEEDVIDDFYDELSEPLVFEDSLEINMSEPFSETKKQNDITIKKDELLLRKNIILIIPIDTKLDSLMGITSQNANEQKVTVEFWKSPINYRGYKRSPNKIVIYGILNFNEVQFISKDKNVYLIDNNNKYSLKLTDEFLKLKSVKQQK